MKARVILGGILILCGASLAEAGSYDTVAGDWSFSQFEAPAYMGKVFQNYDTGETRTNIISSDPARYHELIRDAYFSTPYVAMSSGVSIDGSGVVGGAWNAQALELSRNRLVVSDGNNATSFYMNTTLDAFLSAARPDTAADVWLGLRRSTNLVTADLAGDWFLVTTTKPAELVRTYGTVTIKEVVYGILSDAYFNGQSMLVSGSITALPDGTFTGAFSGTIQARGPSAARVEIPGYPAMNFDVNSAKSILIGTASIDSNRTLSALVRKPATLTADDIHGEWRFVALDLPHAFYTMFLNPNDDSVAGPFPLGIIGPIPPYILDNVLSWVAFGLGRDIAELDGHEPWLTINEADMSVTAALPEGTVVFHPNAQKNFLVAATDYGDLHQVIFGIKVSDHLTTEVNPMYAPEMLADVSPRKFLVAWNFEDGQILQTTTDLKLGPWADVPGSTISGIVPIDLADPKRFYRVAWPAP